MTSPPDAQPQVMGETLVERVADAIDAARFAHPEQPRERPRPFIEADRSDREYAIRLAKAAISASALDAVRGWQPIETAPKPHPDADPIDLYDEMCGRIPDCHWCDGVWVSVGADGTECEVTSGHVTHWRPRPPRPARAAHRALCGEGE